LNRTADMLVGKVQNWRYSQESKPAPVGIQRVLPVRSTASYRVGAPVLGAPASDRGFTLSYFAYSGSAG
jgi:hypothetical protein